MPELPIDSTKIYSIYFVPGPVLDSKEKIVNEVDIASFSHEALSIVKKKN